jgi:hypothetical protein
MDLRKPWGVPPFELVNVVPNVRGRAGEEVREGEDGECGRKDESGWETAGTDEN